MKIQRIDHIGVVVNDLAKAKEFFVDFGFTVQVEAEEQSELLDKVVGLKGAKSQIVFLQAPNGQINWSCQNFFIQRTSRGCKRILFIRTACNILLLS